MEVKWNTFINPHTKLCLLKGETHHISSSSMRYLVTQTLD